MGSQVIFKEASDLFLYYGHHSFQISHVVFEIGIALLKRDALFPDENQKTQIL